MARAPSACPQPSVAATSPSSVNSPAAVSSSRQPRTRSWAGSLRSRRAPMNATSRRPSSIRCRTASRAAATLSIAMWSYGRSKSRSPSSTSGTSWSRSRRSPASSSMGLRISPSMTRARKPWLTSSSWSREPPVVVEQHDVVVLGGRVDDGGGQLGEVRVAELGQRERDDARTALPQVPCGEVGLVAQRVDGPLDPLAHGRCDVLVVVHHVRDGLDGDPRVRGDVLEADPHGNPFVSGPAR